MKKVQLSVREFALPVPRFGHIETHSGYGPPPLTGQEAHSFLQIRRRQVEAYYESEFKLNSIFERKDFQFHISGRVDGHYRHPIPILEEIKTATDVMALREKLVSTPEHPYCLQLQTYAYFYWKTFGTRPRSRFLLYSVQTQEQLLVEHELDVEKFEIWLELRLNELAQDSQERMRAMAKRKKVSKALVFPFQSPRPGQVALMETLEKGFKEKNLLFVQAPTGMGKTAAVIFPTLKNALGRGQKLIYVTPKNSQHAVAEDAVRKIQNEGGAVKSITLTAKSKMCLKKETVCNPNYCEYARDYYSKVAQNNLVKKVARSKLMTARTFKHMGESYQVCPFELSLDSIAAADIVICDYNYVFSPNHSIARLSSTGGLSHQRPNLVIDEAHNLPSRAVDYFSAGLSISHLQSLYREAEKRPHPLYDEVLEKFQSAFRIIRDLINGRTRDSEIAISLEIFQSENEKIKSFVIRYLESAALLESGDPMLQLSRLWNAFTETLEQKGPEFFTSYLSHQEGMLKSTCADAAQQIASRFSDFEQVVAFSATLKPFQYYMRLMGVNETTAGAFEFQSPFPAERRQILLIPQVTTKFSRRIEQAPRIADAIARMAAIRPGNYFAFFPSFDFMNTVASQIQIDGFVLIQQPRDTKLKFVDDVRLALTNKEKSHLVFAVQGGVFSEGVDYPGDMAVGAFIVGPGLPNFNYERERIRAYFDEKYQDGFAYTYTYPAMAKVVQAAGRVIRSENDRGIIVLMDSRFRESTFSTCMPEDWFSESVDELVSNEILKTLQKFWSDAPMGEVVNT